MFLRFCTASILVVKIVKRLLSSGTIYIPLINLHMAEKLRIDKYFSGLSGFFKTRTLSADACNNGKVKCLGVNVKAAKADKYWRAV